MNSKKHDEGERSNPEDLDADLEKKISKDVNGQNEEFVNLLLVVMLGNSLEKMSDDSNIY